MMMANFRERLAFSKQTTNRFHMERFNFKRLNKVEGKKQCCVEISNRLATLEKIDAEVDINRAWGTVRENINI
jgi:hypothetical protein